MNKPIFVVNGMAGCGKDTFAIYLNGCANVFKVSSIDIIKKIAGLCGWDGAKTEKSRKLLSDLKRATTEYNDLSYKYVKGCIEDYVTDDYYDIMLIDIREPEEIRRVVEDFGAKTILIVNDRVPTINSNPSDAGVMNWEYDYVIDNNGTLEDFMQSVRKFAKEIELEVW